MIDMGRLFGFRPLRALGVVVVAAALVLSACGGDDSDGGSSGGNAATGAPIKIGDVTSVSGANVFPESAAVAKLVFKRYNDAGGLKGRPIQLQSEDAQDTAEGAAAAARRLVENNEIMGLCCGGSIVDCTTNAKYYADQKINVLGGVMACGEAPTVSNVNVGPFLPTLHMMDYFYHDLGKKKVCFVGQNVPLTELFKTVFIPMWEKQNNTKLTSMIISEVGADQTPSVAKVKSDGCEAVLVAFTEPEYQAYFGIAAPQGLTKSVPHGMPTSGYALTLAKAAGNTLEGVYVNSEFEPYTGLTDKSPPEVQDFLKLLKDNKMQPTSFGESGYIAANIMIKTLESISGDITRASVNDALAKINYATPLQGTPFTFTGNVGGKQPNPTSKILQYKDGDFRPITGWRTFPLAG
jgi:branched-chain amino acid transport system substrate-binding protein